MGLGEADSAIHYPVEEFGLCETGFHDNPQDSKLWIARMVASGTRSSRALNRDLDDSIGNTRTSRDIPERQSSRVERFGKIRLQLRQAFLVVLRDREYLDCT